MARLDDIANTLFHGFRPYVPKGKLEKYDTDFSTKKRFTSKFLLEFFPRYVNEKIWMKKPKQRGDIYLFNYFYIEAPVMGFTKSKLYNRYVYNRHPRIKGVRFTPNKLIK